MRNVKDSWYSLGRKALCLTAFSVCLTAGKADTDAKDYFDGNVDLDQAKANFETAITTKYPELTEVVWP